MIGQVRDFGESEMMRAILVAALVGVLSGCQGVVDATVGNAALRPEMSAEELRTEEYFYRSEIIPMSIDEILASREAWVTRCRQTHRIEKGVADPNKAYVQSTQGSLAGLSTVTFLEFTQLSSGTETRVDIWTFYKSFHDNIDLFLSRVKNGAEAEC